MVTTTAHCDKCLREIVEGRTLMTTTAGPMIATRPTVDMCRECFAAFSAWLTESPRPDAKLVSA